MPESNTPTMGYEIPSLGSLIAISSAHCIESSSNSITGISLID